MKAVRKFKKSISLTFLLILLFEIGLPTYSFAITGSSSMPEYRSFEPVATTNMVNLSDGSFTYNIPLLDVPNGYPINLSYHSNEISNEALASWVGLGWNINPGAINRVKRGVPDEFKGQEETYFNKMPANWTVGLSADFKPELFGEEGLLDANVGASIRYNNNQGIGTSVTAGLNFAGVANLQVDYSQGKFGFNPEVNPLEILNLPGKIKSRSERLKAEQSLKDIQDGKYDDYVFDEAGFDALANHFDAANKGSGKSPNSFQIGFGSYGGVNISGNGTSYSGMTFNTPISYPSTVAATSGFMLGLKFDIGVNLVCLPLDFKADANGYFTYQKNEVSTDFPMYGYKYSGDALANEKNMMDYTTEKEKTFEKRDNILGYPIPSNDVYSLSGEAMGGSFRSFRTDYGHYRKAHVRSDDYSVNVGADIKLASIVSILPPAPIGIVNQEYTYGGEVGFDYHWTTVGDWTGKFQSSTDATNFTFKNTSSGDETSFYRFSGDNAGYFSLNDINPVSTTTSCNYNPDEPFSATLDKNITDFIVGSNALFTYNSNSNTCSWSGPNGTTSIGARSVGKNKKRSTYILEHKNGDFIDKTTVGGKDIQYKVYEKNLRFVDDQLASTSTVGTTAFDYNTKNSNSPEAAGEIVAYNGDGVTYVYGLPVYSRNEVELRYAIDKSYLSNLNDPGNGALLANVSASADIDGTSKTKLGHAPKNSSHNYNEYPTSHLLTQILSADYIDRTGDGPTQDDFGSYTKFNYIRVTADNDWYSFRSPYSGVNYNFGSLSDNDDDMSSFSYGEKEVYYLHSVVSKTHVAIFTLSNRDDGKGATINDHPSFNNMARSTGGTANQLKKLDRIDLYSLNDCELFKQNALNTGIYQPKTTSVPIKTVHFKYDYSLAPGTTNSNAVTLPCSGIINQGRLTLNKVWFEYGGKLTSKISPYKFDYFYKDLTLPSPYNSDVYDAYTNSSGIKGYGTHGISSPCVRENPSYYPVNSDPWGNYRDYLTMASNSTTDDHSIYKLAKFWPYVHQNPNSANFDPAVFCLKSIDLPSGGKILVQYEQADYQYVQNKRAMMMIPLTTGTNHSESDSDIEDKKYYLDLSKVGIDYSKFPTSDARQKLAEELFQPMIQEQKRIYFNFLYALIGSNDPDYTSLTSDYVEGYSRIDGFGHDGNGVFFMFKKSTTPSGSGVSYTSISYSSEASTRELPRKVCREFYLSNRRGKIGIGQQNTLDDNADNMDGKSIGEAFLNILESIKGDILDEKCARFKPEMSYVRVQVPAGNYRVKDVGNAGNLPLEPYAKLGGGVRVKRLLMYADAMVSKNTSEPTVLYGNEYEYRTRLNESDPSSPIISSGVASNEPATCRRESPLVNPIEKDAQGELDAILFGRDMYGMEGPIGESFLPSPAICYSKVTVKNIHSGTTGTGSEVHEYYTDRDFPFIARSTSVDQVFKEPVSFSTSIGPVSVSYTRKVPFLAQGYSFISYSMRGREKRVSKYAQGNTTETLAEQTYEYFKEGDMVKIMGDDNIERTTRYEEMGKESEILSEASEIDDYSLSASIGVDVSVGGEWVYIPPFAPAFFPVPSKTKVKGGGGVVQNIIRRHVTSKIITYPAIVKKVTNKADGVTQTSENIVFDDHTGMPVVVKTTDDFKGAYVNQDFMAPWQYTNMKSKYQNEDMVIPSGGGVNINYFAQTGNEGYLQFTGNSCGLLLNFTRGDYLHLWSSASSTSASLHHVNRVDLANNRLYLYASQYSTSTPSSSTNLNVRILRSGYTNQLNAKTGSIMYFKKDGSTPYFAGTSLLDNSGAFVSALNTALTNVSSTTSINLSGTFNNMDIRNYAAYIPSVCSNIDLSKATISSVIIDVVVTGGNVTTLTVKSFTLQGCSGGDQTISCIAI